ncbi:hypothetical protein Tco_0109249 [Tanacetum coccineum]
MLASLIIGIVSQKQTTLACLTYGSKQDVPSSTADRILKYHSMFWQRSRGIMVFILDIDCVGSDGFAGWIATRWLMAALSHNTISGLRRIKGTHSRILLLTLSVQSCFFGCTAGKTLTQQGIISIGVISLNIGIYSNSGSFECYCLSKLEGKQFSWTLLDRGLKTVFSCSSFLRLWIIVGGTGVRNGSDLDAFCSVSSSDESTLTLGFCVSSFFRTNLTPEIFFLDNTYRLPSPLKIETVFLLNIDWDVSLALTSRVCLPSMGNMRDFYIF